MGGVGTDDGSTYSPLVAFIYVFNLVVGTGALALPAVLTSGGWWLGSLFLTLVAFSSFIGVTFMIESMASANALLHLESKMEALEVEMETILEGDDGLPLPMGPNRSLTLSQRSISHSLSPFEISHRTELGQMADMFFSDWGRIFFYIALILYLFGDAAIYCTFVPRSLVGFVYGSSPPPWAFDACLLAFVLFIVPFCFFDFQKTKPLQMITMFIRNAALFTMISLAIWMSFVKGTHTEGVPNFKISALPNLFGGAVYAFMCHHSLPGIITPMREKTRIPLVMKAAFIAVFTIYFLLFLTCAFAFGLKAEDPITFNFPPNQFGWVGNLLFLFPVFTLSSNYPMLTITLRNNLDTLLQLIFTKGTPLGAIFSPRRQPKGRYTALPVVGGVAGVGGEGGGGGETNRRIIVTLLAVVPPIFFCLLAEHRGLDVSSLVGLTGAYAGAAVMFIIPACLVHSSRVLLAQEIPAPENVVQVEHSAHVLNPHASPFKSRNWVIALIVMANIAIVFITFDEIFV